MTELTDSPAIDCGIEPYEGILLAYLPPIDVVMSEHLHGDTILFALDGMAIDTHPAKKWWLVRNLARAHRLDYPEPVWQGPAQDLTYRTVEAIFNQQNGMQVGKKLHMRAFSRGPWICLEGPNGVEGQIKAGFEKEEQKDGTVDSGT